MTLGLDISTSTIGVSIFSEEGKLMSLNYVKLKGDTLFEKVDIFISFMEENNFDKFLIKHLAVEESLKLFKGKFSNADTIQKLTAMNYMVSFWCYKTYDVLPTYYNVQTIRKIAFPELKLPQKEANKKHKVWEQVMQLEPQINWIYSKKTHKLTIENYDMADSYACGLADIICRKKQN
jgi:hypothetical protein